MLIGKQTSIALIAATIFLTALQPANSNAPNAIETSASPTDEQIIRHQALEYTEAFAKGDSAKLASMWSTDGRYTDSAGREFSGRARIQKLFSNYFDIYKGRALTVDVSSLKFPASQVAIEEGIATLKSDELPISSARYVAVHIKGDSGWQMESVQETPIETPSGSLPDLEWLLGQWSTEREGKIVKMICSWDPGNHFLLLKNGDDTKSSTKSIQIIGFDASTNSLLAWHFDSTGGFGNGKWVRINDTWVQNAVTVRPDGQTGGATYILNKINNDEFTWSSKNRFSGSQRLPDMPVLTVKRTTNSSQ